MSRSSRVLAVLCAAQLVFILDVAVVNVAIVPLAFDLDADPSVLALVASAYAAAFGGGLLAAGRFADAGHARAMFAGGLVGFAAASSLCGAAPTIGVLVAGRAAQGLAAAAASPAALALLTRAFAEGTQRDRALGIWAAVAAAGGAVGLLLGGVLTDVVGWRSVFYVNVPAIMLIVTAAVRVLPRDAPPRNGPRTLPVAAAAGAGLTVVSVVFGLAAAEAGYRGPASALMATAAAAAVTFWVRDRRSTDPLVLSGLLGSRSVAAANTATASMSAVVLGINFFLAVHLQGRLGFGPITTGLAFLPVTVTSAVTAVLAARNVARFGVRTLLAAGLTAMCIGCLLLAGTLGGYPAGVLPGLVLVAAGMGPGFALTSIAGTTGVSPTHLGSAAALLSTSLQVGAAIGLAFLGLLSSQFDDPTDGARAAFDAMAGLALLAVPSALTLPAEDSVWPPSRTLHLPSQPAYASGCLPGCNQASTRPPAAAPAD